MGGEVVQRGGGRQPLKVDATRSAAAPRQVSIVDSCWTPEAGQVWDLVVVVSSGRSSSVVGGGGDRGPGGGPGGGCGGHCGVGGRAVKAWWWPCRVCYLVAPT